MPIAHVFGYLQALYTHSSCYSGVRIVPEWKRDSNINTIHLLLERIMPTPFTPEQQRAHDEAARTAAARNSEALAVADQFAGKPFDHARENPAALEHLNK